MKHHNQWASKMGFILATAGSAIGLGNLWKFPYLMGRNGGFSFLAVYLIFILVLGIPIMIAEMSLGRKTRKNPVDAYAAVHPHAKIVGGIGVLSAFLILSYYSVIGGWILKYFVSYLTTFRAPENFEAFIGGTWEPILWHFVFMACTAAICLFGVRGIEKASKVMMPALFLLLLFIIGRSVTLPGAGEGLRFVFTPQSGGLTLGSVSAALGQVFYSLSLCMGITITYGSYLNNEANIPKSCLSVAGLDTAMAILSGIAIFPAVFSFGLEPGQGPSLIFGTLPKVFSALSGGSVFAMLFFLLVFFAAITSSIALLEVTASYAIGSLRWPRKKAVLLLSALTFLLGIPSSLSFGPLANARIFNYPFFDFIGMLTDNLLLPLGGVLLCYYIGWRWKPSILEAEIKQNGVRFRLFRVWLFLIRFVTPVLVLVVMITGFINIYQVVA